MSIQSHPAHAPAIKALAKKVTVALDPQIMAIVATVDAMMDRGQADQLVAPLRQRLKTLRPPRPLRFARLIFYPLEPLIVPATRWQRGQLTIPRTALTPIAEHVRKTMGPDAEAITTGLAGVAPTDTGQIIKLGRTLWPAATAILAGPEIPARWGTTELGVSSYRPMADLIVALLSQAMALELLCANTANGLLPPDEKAVAHMVDAVARVNKTAVPAMLTLLLDRLPKLAPQLMRLRIPTPGVDIQAAFDQAADLLLRQLDENDGLEACIAAGTLADAGAAVNRIVTILRELDTSDVKPRRREHLRELRERLDTGCRARFASGLRDEVLAPLQHLGVAPSSEELAILESAARGLRSLEFEARIVAGGAAYDQLLSQAGDAIKDKAMRDRLLLPDQVRLVEILAGPDAALALLKSKG